MITHRHWKPLRWIYAEHRFQKRSTLISNISGWFIVVTIMVWSQFLQRDRSVNSPIHQSLSKSAVSGAVKVKFHTPPRDASPWHTSLLYPLNAERPTRNQHVAFLVFGSESICRPSKFCADDIITIPLSLVTPNLLLLLKIVLIICSFLHSEFISGIQKKTTSSEQIVQSYCFLHCNADVLP